MYSRISKSDVQGKAWKALERAQYLLDRVGKESANAQTDIANAYSRLAGTMDRDEGFYAD